MEKVAEKILNLALQYAFQITGTNAEQLNVFNENALVKQGYEKVGFVERNMDKDDKQCRYLRENNFLPSLNLLPDKSFLHICSLNLRQSESSYAEYNIQSALHTTNPLH